MDKKPGAARTTPPTAHEGEQHTSVSRRRFSEGETSIMRLDEVLRQRPGGPSVVVPPPQSAPPAQRGLHERTMPNAQSLSVQRSAASQWPDTPPPPPPSRGAPAPAASEDNEDATRQVDIRALRAASSSRALAPDPSLSASAIGRAVDDVLADQKADLAARRGPAPAQRSAATQSVANQVVVFFSCKGGSGATALATNVAHIAARSGHASCLVDMDLQLGDALAACALTPRVSLAQAGLMQAEGRRLNMSLFAQHGSGLAVLSQVGQIDDMDKVNAELLGKLFAGLRQNFELLVIDGVRDFGDNALAVLDGADKVALVIVPEVLALRRARWAYGILRKIGFAAEDIAIVPNQFVPSNDMPLSALAQMFESTAPMPIPLDKDVVTHALNRGISLGEFKPKNVVTQAVRRLTRALLYNAPFDAPGDAAMAGAVASKPGFMSKLFGRRGQA